MTDVARRIKTGLEPILSSGDPRDRMSAYHDMPYAIFRYDPDDEFELRKEITLLTTRLTQKGKHVKRISLVECLDEAMRSQRPLDEWFAAEREQGTSTIVETVHSVLSEYAPLVDLVAARMPDQPDPLRDIVFIMRAGALFPMYRTNSLLEQLKGRVTVPTVLFYPGDLDAAGRLDRAMQAVEMLTTDDGARAEELAQALDLCNKQRQEVEKRIVEEAHELITTSGGMKDRGAIIVGREGWHPGVIGIVASRLVDTYHRPAVVVALGTRARPGFGPIRPRLQPLRRPRRLLRRPDRLRRPLDGRRPQIPPRPLRRLLPPLRRPLPGGPHPRAEAEDARDRRRGPPRGVLTLKRRRGDRVPRTPRDRQPPARSWSPTGSR